MDRDEQGGLMDVFAPNVSGVQAPIYGAGPLAPYCCFLSILLSASTYSRNTDQLIGLVDIAVLAAYTNTPATPLLRQYNPNLNSSDTLTAMAADQAGNLFVSDATTNTVLVLAPSGASFAPGAAIAGPKTGLGGITSMTIGIP